MNCDVFFVCKIIPQQTGTEGEVVLNCDERNENYSSRMRVIREEVE